MEFLDDLIIKKSSELFSDVSACNFREYYVRILKTRANSSIKKVTVFYDEPFHSKIVDLAC